MRHDPRVPNRRSSQGRGATGPMNPFSEDGSVGIVETQTVAIDLPPGGFVLESGGCLPELTIAYEAYGERSAAKDNVIFICHALTGDAHVAGRHAEGEREVGWWDQMVGPGKGIDTDHYHVICANILGGCKGTTGPSSINPATGKPYGSAFPHLTVGDMVQAHVLLLRQLGIQRLAAVVGGSFGGMQVLEWMISYPEMVERAVCIASAVSLSTQALSFDIVGRKAITSDPKWHSGNYYASGEPPHDGLALARGIGHITYLSPKMMDSKFGRVRRSASGKTTQPPSRFRSDFEVERYLDHQGHKFVQRFDANSYLYITRAMDEFDLEARHAPLDRLFENVRSKILVVALDSDWLFPPEQSRVIANALLRAGKQVSHCLLRAPHGHDAFLVDVEHLAEVIHAFLPWVGKKLEAVDAARATGESARPRRPRDNNVSPAPEAVATRRRRFPWCSCETLEGRGSEYQRIVRMIHDGARVLDLGCGDGELLSLLARERHSSGIGLDIDIENVIRVIDRGHDIFQEDIDAGLAMIPDQTYDYAILSETLQVVRKPRLVLNEMLRVAGQGIVAFPNFGKWFHRLYLSATGRMPKGGALPYEWYNTPNIHLFTAHDFLDLCREDQIDVLDMVCLPAGWVDRTFLRLGLCNAGAERILVRIARRRNEQGGSVKSLWQK